MILWDPFTYNWFKQLNNFAKADCSYLRHFFLSFFFCLEGWIVCQRQYGRRATLGAIEVLLLFLIMVTNNSQQFLLISLVNHLRCCVCTVNLDSFYRNQCVLKLALGTVPYASAQVGVVLCGSECAYVTLLKPHHNFPLQAQQWISLWSHQRKPSNWQPMIYSDRSSPRTGNLVFVLQWDIT